MFSIGGDVLDDLNTLKAQLQDQPELYCCQPRHYLAVETRHALSLPHLPDPDVLTAEIVENIESALGNFRNIIAQLKK